MKKVIMLLLAIIMISSCSFESETAVKRLEFVGGADVRVNISDRVYQIKFARNVDGAVSYDSENKRIAMVDDFGEVTLLSTGTVNIIVVRHTQGDLPELREKITLRIEAAGIAAEDFENEVVLNKTTTFMAVGGAERLEVLRGRLTRELPVGEITWDSSDPSVASVDKAGVVFALQPGVTTITAMRSNGKQSECTVVVSQESLRVEKLEISDSNKEITIGSLGKLEAIITPPNATRQGVQWYSENEDIVKVGRGGVIFGIKKGVGMIVAVIDEENQRAEIEVRVVEPITEGLLGFSIFPENPSYLVGETGTLTYDTIPPGLDLEVVPFWVSETPSVVEIDVDSGDLVANSVGTGVVFLSVEGSSIETRAFVEVTNRRSITVVPNTVTMYKGDKQEVQVSIFPSSQIGAKLKVISSNSVADIKLGCDDNIEGNDDIIYLVAKEIGDVLIHVGFADGISGDISGELRVNVVDFPPVTGLKINEGSFDLAQGASKEVTLRVTPDFVPIPVITWKSTNENNIWVNETGTGADRKWFVEVSADAPIGTFADISAHVGSTVQSDAIRVVVMPGVLATEITLEPREKTIAVGERFSDWIYTIKPAGAEDQAVRWSSSNDYVLVDELTGEILGISAGTARITVKPVYAESDSVLAWCTVKVEDKVAVTSIQIAPNEVKLVVGTSMDALVIILPENATNKSYSWHSDDDSIAILDGGKIVGLKQGKAIITVVSEDGGHEATCEVTVVETLVGVSILPEQASILLQENSESVLNLAVVSNPVGAVMDTVEWQIDGSDILEFVGDTDKPIVKVKGIKEGVTQITVVVNGTETAERLVTVTWGVTGLFLDRYTLSMDQGSDDKLTAIPLPKGVSTKVLWHTSDASIVEVNPQTGELRAVASGSEAIATAVITATTERGNHSRDCTITVYPRLTGLEFLQGDEYEVEVGKTLDLGSQIKKSPEAAQDREIVFSSSDESGVFASLDTATGVLTAKSVGELKVTGIMKTPYGDFSAVCSVTIVGKKIPVDLIRVVPAKKTIIVGYPEQLTAEVYPADATDKMVTWTSSDSSIAMVDAETGEVTAVKVGGPVLITATANDGSNIAGSSTIHTKYEKVTGVQIEKEAIFVPRGEKRVLEVLISPDNASDKTVQWLSDNPSIASIDKNTGEITGVTVGQTSVKVTTVDGGFSDECLVTVTDPSVIITGVNLNKNVTYMRVNETEQLSARVLPYGIANQNVTWRTSDQNIADVDANGLIKSYAVGKAIITVETEDKNHTATCLVNVEERSVSVKSVTLNKTELTLLISGTEQLAERIIPANATNQRVEWKSSDTSIARVDSKGFVLGVSVGSAVITVTTVDGNRKATCKVDVKDKIISVTGIKLSTEDEFIAVNNKKQLHAIIEPSNATNQSLVWMSDLTSIVEVSSSGEIFAKSAGKARIRVETVDGKFSDTCLVTVSDREIPVTSIKLLPDSMIIEPKMQRIITVEFTPPDATNQAVTFSSDNLSVATVDAKTGEVTAIADGEAIITAKQAGVASKTCFVRVGTLVTQLRINEGKMNIAIGEKGQFTVAIEPDNATDGTVTWTSSNSAIASVDSVTGEVTGIGSGSAIITATTNDGSGLTASQDVGVTYSRVTGLELAKTATFVSVGGREKLLATVKPENATIKKLKWTSEDSNIVRVDEETGRITGISAGSAFVIVRTIVGGFEDACFVTVTKNSIAASDVSLNKNATYMQVNQTERLSARLIPYNASNQTVTWSTSDESIASVDVGGVITSHRVGQAVITVKTAEGGYTATCLVNVEAITVPVTEVTLNKTEMSLLVNGTEQLAERIIPFIATNQTVRWESSNTNVAIVSVTGLVIGRSVGNAVITVTTVDGSRSATCAVQVLPNSIAVKNLTMSKENEYMVVNTKKQIYAVIDPENATNQNLAWTSSDSAIAEVSSTGEVFAKSAGQVRIKVRVKAASGNINASCLVTVSASEIPVSTLKITPDSLRLDPSETKKVQLVFTPSHATNQEVTWKAVPEDVVKINEQTGEITGIKEGRTIITVTTVNGITAECTVSVGFLAQSIKINEGAKLIAVGQKTSFTVTIKPDSVTDKTVTWTSNKPETASVDLETGEVTGLKDGTAIITATTNDGSELKDTQSVKVTFINVNSIEIGKSATYMTIGSTEQLHAIIRPSNASNKEVTWESSNTRVVTVDEQTGLITGVSEGNAYISVRTVDGGYSDLCFVTVTRNAVSVVDISLNKNVTYMKENETERLSATLIPFNATNQNITWSSSDQNVVSVDNVGLITSHKTGNAIITAKTVDGGRTATCLVHVEEVNVSVTDVTLNKKELVLLVDEIEQLAERIIPANATNQTVLWESYNTAVARVDSKGFVIGVSAGQTVVTVATVDGYYHASCTVVVSNNAISVTGVKITTEDEYLAVNTKKQLYAVMEPANATNQKLMWTSDSTRIVEVSSSGELFAKSVGSATVKVESVDGRFSDTCLVTVTDREIIATSIELDPPLLQLKPEETKTLKVLFTPSDTTNRSLSFTSKDPKIAKVDKQTGVVTGVQEGKTTIEVRTASGLTKECSVHVVYLVENLSIRDDVLNLLAGGNTGRFSVTITPGNASDKTLTWSIVGDSDVIEILDKKTGEIRGLKDGRATVQAVANDGSGKSVEGYVSVSVPVRGVRLEPSSLLIGLEEQDRQLKVVFEPENPSNQLVHWSSSDKKIVDVSGTGKLIPYKVGPATIIVTTDDGKFEGRCDVTVTSISLNFRSLVMAVGETKRLKATIYSEDEFDWWSRDPEIADVESNGRVTAKSVGDTVVYVKAKNSAVTTSCDIFVKPSAANILLSRHVINTGVGMTEPLTAIAIPSDSAIAWSTTRPNVARYDSVNNLVVAVSQGSTVIKAASANGKVFDECVVNVKSIAQNVSINPTSMTGLYKGDLFKIEASAFPKDAYVQDLEWTFRPVGEDGGVVSFITGVSEGNTDVAVGHDVVIRGEKAGSVYVRATAKPNLAAYAECLITVVEPLKGFSFAEENVKMYLRETSRVVVNFDPPNAYDKKLEWSSNNASIVGVRDGLLSANGVGQTKIIAQNKALNYQAECIVEVFEKAASVQLNHDTVLIPLAEEAFLSASVLPNRSTVDKRLVWESSDPSTVRVTDGKIEGLQLGTATITATAFPIDNNSKKDICLVEVIVPVERVLVSPEALKLEVGKKAQIQASAEPLEASYQGIDWESSDEDVAIVNGAGKVTALSKGEANIFAISKEGMRVNNCFVEVFTVDVEKVSLDRNIEYMVINDERSLKARIEPEKATNQSLEWASSEASIVSINPET
ncbi:MAG: Ig-like domain-containing protein, partial [Treponemataceae bacterium]